MKVDTVTAPPEYCTSMAFGQATSTEGRSTFNNRVSVPAGALAKVNAAACFGSKRRHIPLCRCGPAGGVAHCLGRIDPESRCAKEGKLAPV